jgi:hypothetical protein
VNNHAITADWPLHSVDVTPAYLLYTPRSRIWSGPTAFRRFMGLICCDILGTKHALNRLTPTGGYHALYAAIPGLARGQNPARNRITLSHPASKSVTLLFLGCHQTRETRVLRLTIHRHGQRAGLARTLGDLPKNRRVFPITPLKRRSSMFSASEHYPIRINGAFQEI